MMSVDAPSPPPLTLTASAAADTTTTVSGVRLFISRLSDAAGRSFADRRPWSELTDRSAFSRPENLAEATARLRRNLAYFKVNYATVVAGALAATLIAHPLALASLLSLAAAWFHLYLFRPSDPPLVLFGRSFSDRETLVGLSLLSVIVIFMTSVGSILISAVVVAGLAVAVHGAYRVPEDLFLDDKELDAGIGLLSIFGIGGGRASSSSSGPTVGVRV